MTLDPATLREVIARIRADIANCLEKRTRSGPWELDGMDRAARLVESMMPEQAAPGGESDEAAFVEQMDSYGTENSDDALLYESAEFGRLIYLARRGASADQVRADAINEVIDFIERNHNVPYGHLADAIRAWMEKGASQ